LRAPRVSGPNAPFYALGRHPENAVRLFCPSNARPGAAIVERMANIRNKRRVRLAEVRQEIAELKTKMRDIPDGVKSVSIDGTTTNWDKAAAEKRLEFLLDREAALAGGRQRVAGIDLSGGF